MTSTGAEEVLLEEKRVWDRQFADKLAVLNQHEDTEGCCFTCEAPIITSLEKHIRCGKCKRAIFCVEECYKKYTKGTRKHQHTPQVCNKYRVYSEVTALIEKVDAAQGEPTYLSDGKLPDNFPKKLPKSWTRYRELRNFPAVEEDAFGLVSTSLTFPLSLVYGLERALHKNYLNPRTDLHLHIIGAEASEGDFPRLFGEAVSLLPHIEHVYITLVGPDLETETGEPAVYEVALEGVDKSYTVSLFPGLSYHDFVFKYMAGGDASDEESEGEGEEKKETKEKDSVVGKEGDAGVEAAIHPPDVAFCFNSGLSDFFEPWSPTVELLLEEDIPTIFTSYSKVEADFDSRFLKVMLNGRVKQGPFLNPYHSLMYSVSPYGPTTFFASNMYMTIVQGQRGAPVEASPKALEEKGEDSSKKRVRETDQEIDAQEPVIKKRR